MSQYVTAAEDILGLLLFVVYMKSRQSFTWIHMLLHWWEVCVSLHEQVWYKNV